jgi:hypothetical protein
MVLGVCIERLLDEESTCRGKSAGNRQTKSLKNRYISIYTIRRGNLFNDDKNAGTEGRPVGTRRSDSNLLPFPPPQKWMSQVQKSGR